MGQTLPTPERSGFYLDSTLEKTYGGMRLTSLQPIETACPLDRAQETMEHTLTECRFLPTTFHLAVQCIGPIPHEGGTVVDPREVLVNTPVLLVSTPLGLVYWSAIRASRYVRCTHKFLALAAPRPGPTSCTRGLRFCLNGKNTPAPPSQRVKLPCCCMHSNPWMLPQYWSTPECAWLQTGRCPCCTNVPAKKG